MRGDDTSGLAGLTTAVDPSISATTKSREAIDVPDRDINPGGETAGVSHKDLESGGKTAGVGGPSTTTAQPEATQQQSELFLGWHNKKDGRRTMSRGNDSVEDARFCRNGFMVVAYRDTLGEIMDWVVMVHPIRSKSSAQDVLVQDGLCDEQHVDLTVDGHAAASLSLDRTTVGQQMTDSGGIDQHDPTSLPGRTSTSRPSAYRPATTQESPFDSGFDPSRLDTRYTYRPPQNPVFGLSRPQAQSHFTSNASQVNAPVDHRISSPISQPPASPTTTPPSRSPSNPYAPIYLTPLQDKSQRDANDYYLSGREGLTIRTIPILDFPVIPSWKCSIYLVTSLAPGPLLISNGIKCQNASTNSHRWSLQNS